VIVASYNSRTTVERCLESLERQTMRDLEVILVDSSSDDTASFVAAQFPEVRLSRHDVRRYPGDARNVGVALARGPILAFLDADCIAADDWAASILDAHRASEAPLIGGAVEHAVPGELIGWARYFCEFSQWMPSRPAAPAIEIPMCCLSVKRWAFERFGPFLEGCYCSDTAFNWRAGAAGHPPLFLPWICVRHIHPPGLRVFLLKQRMHGRNFARVRVSEKRLAPAWAAALALGSPLLPCLLAGRIARRVLPSSQYRGVFLRALPLIFWGLAEWSLGECAGYLEAVYGGGRS
jgi:glycosyltransferase involved in cell wall biosynthesis